MVFPFTLIIHDDESKYCTYSKEYSVTITVGKAISVVLEFPAYSTRLPRKVIVGQPLFCMPTP